VATGQEPPGGGGIPSLCREWILKITSDSWRTVATVALEPAKRLARRGREANKIQFSLDWPRSQSLA
jgi:hypothetical protein